MLRMTRAATMGVLIIGTVLLRLSQAMAGVTPLPGAYLSQMHGHITAIDTATNTVVIEMPREHDAFMIVGTLSPTAVVTKGGKVVPLSALHAGDEVRVHWGQTAAGRQITQLAASQPSRSLQSPLEYSLRPRRSVSRVSQRLRALDLSQHELYQPPGDECREQSSGQGRP